MKQLAPLDYEVYLGDCNDIMPTLFKHIDGVITDPPYGIKMDKGFAGAGGFGETSGTTGWGGTQAKKIPRRQYEDEWDTDRPSSECMENVCIMGKQVFIFGGNFFADMLPRATHWIVWDKKNTMPSFGDAELIWTNSKRVSVKIMVHEYNGLLGKEEERVHPTQKPVILIKKLIYQYKLEGLTIFDPFMGSGTTGVAALQCGCSFIGIEANEKYFQIAADRLRKEKGTPRLL